MRATDALLLVEVEEEGNDLDGLAQALRQKKEGGREGRRERRVSEHCIHS